MAASTDSIKKFVSEFETLRRQRILTFIIPFALAIIGIAVIGGIFTIIQGKAQNGVTVSVSLSVILMICMAISYYLLAQKHITAASLIFTISAITVITGLIVDFCIVQSLTAQSLVQLSSLDIIIILAGTIAGENLILISAAIEMITIALIALFVPQNGIFTTPQDRALVLIGILTYHGAIALLMYILSRSQRQTLTTLGETNNELVKTQQVDQLKDQFITQVNHELRTPIMSLQGYVDLLYELDDSLSYMDRKDMLQKARKSGETLIQFVNDLLDTRRVDQDSVFESVYTPVRPAINDAISLIDPRETKQQIRPITVDAPETIAVLGDPFRLRQILANLVTNAMKYSSQGSPIEIHARAYGAMAEITVRDFGLGIPPEQAGLLFNRFVRLERDLNSPIRGTGVGLYLCRRYAEAMGGSITVESSGEPGKGSRFIVLLPLAYPQAVSAGLTPTTKLGRNNQRI